MDATNRTNLRGSRALKNASMLSKFPSAVGRQHLAEANGASRHVRGKSAAGRVELRKSLA